MTKTSDEILFLTNFSMQVSYKTSVCGEYIFDTHEKISVHTSADQDSFSSVSSAFPEEDSWN